MGEVTQTTLDRVRDQVRAAAYLYESPGAFEAGVDATLEAVEAHLATAADGEGAAVSARGLVVELDPLEVHAR